jgi:phospholipid/cholesterol/gamma-HCH transport system substrate-binding protein
MESEARYAIVGAVVIALVAGLIAAAVWLSKSGFDDDGEKYVIYFRRHDLSGLQTNSYVTMRGIKVGAVTDVQILPDNIEQIKTTVQLRAGTPVKTNTEAVVLRNLLTGFATIDLINSSKEAGNLIGAPSGEDFPVIKEGRTQLAEITSNLPEIVARFGDGASRVNALLSDQNLRSVQMSLANLEKVSGMLASRSQDIEHVVLNFKNFSNDLSKEGGTILTGIDRTLVGLDETIMALRKEFTEGANAMRRALVLATRDMGTIAQSVSQLADAVNVTAERFEDPRSLIIGPPQEALGPGEKVRK